MSWPTLMTFAFVGLAASIAGIVLAAYQGVRYHRWLPKRDTVESLAALKLRLAEKRREYEQFSTEVARARLDIQAAEERRKWMVATEERIPELEGKKRELDALDM